MTDNMRTALSAVNKFMFFSWNYSWTSREINGKSVTLPSFLAEVEWTCNLQHMYNKWMECVTDRKGNDRDSYAFLPRFYAELDGENRRALLEWVMSHDEGNNPSGISLGE